MACSFFALVLILAPAFVLWWAFGVLRTNRRVRQRTHNARALGYYAGVTLVDGDLVLRGGRAGSATTLVDATRVCMTLLDGDRGFADANSLKYVFVVETRSGERVTFTTSWQGCRDFEQLDALRRNLRALGIFEDGGEIAGAIVAGFVPLILAVLTLVWLAVAAVVCRWNR